MFKTQKNIHKVNIFHVQHNEHTPTRAKWECRQKNKCFNGHPYGRSGGVSTSAHVDPGLVRTELGQLTGWI